MFFTREARIEAGTQEQQLEVELVKTTVLVQFNS